MFEVKTSSTTELVFSSAHLIKKNSSPSVRTRGLPTGLPLLADLYNLVGPLCPLPPSLAPYAR
ncbi:hypothetical protein RO3G_12724 [Rhizopus delemar RA 99-880]|uniref:Uncharacterized protein n=1 Tax=Rhizopus delemar (strain RA 99-880 / ATCC MYA-4621 / FGSC 9543 / NRRL 43880) TaxID=246409 RepID=I1CHT3_RHIO9|nr:hypothetical protein RO3G_12724 [Rhizopus delemar RA 99-880]|eukprot:EIE88013.1 hypothetical protein RO3G_12724 [Rhizopus delemar RA 99-880]